MFRPSADSARGHLSVIVIGVDLAAAAGIAPIETDGIAEVGVIHEADTTVLPTGLVIASALRARNAISEIVDLDLLRLVVIEEVLLLDAVSNERLNFRHRCIYFAFLYLFTYLIPVVLVSLI